MHQRELEFHVATLSQNIRMIGAGLSLSSSETRRHVLPGIIYPTAFLRAAIGLRRKQPPDSETFAMNDLATALGAFVVAVVDAKRDLDSIRDGEWATVRDSHNKVLAAFVGVVTAELLGEPWTGA